MLKFNSITKVVFDLVMLALLAAVYCAQPTGIPVHEYIGVGVYALFIIHLVYNYKWIINAGKRLFDKTLGIRVKFMYAVDVLLLMAFIAIGLSGVMISHVIFKLGIMPVWRPLHSIASAVSIVLLSVHIGLHGNMIINAVKTKIRLPFMAIKISAAVIFVIILCAGVYGDIVSKTGPAGNQVTRRPRFETVLALFERSVSFISGPPEYVRNRATGGGEGQRPSQNNNAVAGQRPSQNNNTVAGQRPPQNNINSERQRPPQNTFKINVLLISISNYMAFVLLCSIIVFLIDSKIKELNRNVVLKERAGSQINTIPVF